MAKYKVKELKLNPFPAGIDTTKLKVEAVTDLKTKNIIKLLLTIKDKVESFPIKKGDFQTAWQNLVKRAQEGLKTGKK